MRNPRFLHALLLVVTAFLFSCSDAPKTELESAVPSVPLNEDRNSLQPNDDRAEDELTPTDDETTSSKVYIPESLEDSFLELDKMLSRKFIERFKAGGRDVVIDQHFGLGLWIRNNWGLWGGSRLAQHFRALGIFHPDDMSSIILESYHRRLNGRPVELEQQIRKYQEYWKKQKQ